MFSLFKKKEPSIRVMDTVWMNSGYKWKAVEKNLVQPGNNTVFICWFDDTYANFQSIATRHNLSFYFFLAKEISSVHINGKSVVFAEHYPLLAKETALYEKLHLTAVHVWSALDEPLLSRFGGERIVDLMKKLGMAEDEAIEHAMISASIRNAQKKIQEKISSEQSAVSQEDWLRKNGA